MSFSAAKTLQDKWPLFVKYGATKACVYQSMTESTYTSGTVAKDVISSHNVDIVFDSLGGGSVQKYQQTLDDGSTIRVTDRVAIFPTLNLPVVPKISDLIVDPSLKEWEVKAVAEDPVDAHYELWVRPIK